MEKKLPMWKPIKMGDRLPCQSFFRKKDGEILKLSSVAGVKVGQDGYYLPVDEVIEEIRNFPIDESEDEKIRKKIIKLVKEHSVNHERCQMEAWLGKQGEHANFLNKIQIGDNVTRNQDGVLVNLSQLDRVAKKDEKYEQKPAWSEEDENMLDIIITDINFAQKFYHTSKLTSYDKKINWLKSLRPQNQWKPSEEQMENLSRAFNGEVYRASLLMELYQDLKKLKE